MENSDFQILLAYDSRPLARNKTNYTKRSKNIYEMWLEAKIFIRYVFLMALLVFTIIIMKTLTCLVSIVTLTNSVTNIKNESRISAFVIQWKYWEEKRNSFAGVRGVKGSYQPTSRLSS